MQVCQNLCLALEQNSLISASLGLLQAVILMLLTPFVVIPNVYRSVGLRVNLHGIMYD